MICDVCGQRIENESQLCIQWLKVGSSRYGYRIVHGEQESDPEIRCHYNRQKAKEQGASIEEVYLDYGSRIDMVFRFLAFLKQGNCNVAEVAEIIQRLLSNDYDEARRYIEEAINDGVFERNTPYYYHEGNIKDTLEYARKKYPERFRYRTGGNSC